MRKLNCHPYEYLEESLDKGLLLICDHARNSVPPGYRNLGLSDPQLERHIAYDIGAASVTSHLSKRLGAPALLSTFSRLLIDPNRGDDDPTLVMRLSDGAVIPGNAEITAEGISERIDKYYRPYHDKINSLVDEFMSAGLVPALVSIHSFTAHWKDQLRPWHIAVLSDKDQRFARPLIERLNQEEDLVIGDNVPYTGQMKGDCLYRHGTSCGLAHVLIEIRQDLITTEAGQKEWGQRLSHMIEDVIADDDDKGLLHQIKHYGSFT